MASQVCIRCLLANALTPDGGGDSDERFGDYTILCEIGQGGMGIVYLAEQSGAIRREVALKALKSGLDTAEVLQRFDTERKALAMMEHPGIATLHDAGVSNRGRPYFVMEFVDGAPITAACDSRRAGVPQRLSLFAETCRAIDHAHRKGVVHRDIKPSNVLVTERDGCLAPKVIDFGIARAVTGYLTANSFETVFGELLGTPDYMSPEQASFETRKVGPASDTYSLGVLLYELLAGVLPFDPAQLREAGMVEATRRIREEDVPPPSVRLQESGRADEIAGLRSTKPDALRRLLSGELSSIINMCLDKDPARRYGSVAALADDIDRYLHGEPVAAQSRTLVYRIGKWLRKRRSAVAVIAVAAAAAVTGSWIASRPARSPLEPVPLTTYRGSESAPTFSPDARDVAFAWDGEHEDNWDIYRLHIGDNTPVRLTRGPAADYAPAWSPDGKSIAFLQAQSDDTANLMLMPAEGGPARQIAVAHMNINPRKRWITWSRDGQWLLLAHRGPGAPHQRVFAISVTNGEQRQLTHPNGPPSESDGQPALSLDGKIVLFARDSDTPGQLWMLPVTSDVRPAGVERRIKVPGFEGKECEVPLPISASELLFLAPLRSVRTFWRGKLSGGREPDALPELGQLPMAMDLSRDGRKLVFSKQNYDSNVWRIDLDAAGGKEIRRERILASTQWDENPALSPDGTTLAFESNRGGFPEIWLASVDGSDARPLTALGTLAASPLWSPDGSQIAFQGSRNGKSEVFVVPANGGAPREPAPDSAEAIQPVWSPDGKWLYFCSLRTGSREIWRVPAQGGQASQVTRHGGFDLAFSPDGSWIYYSRERASSTSIWRMPAEGGPESRLIESAIGGHVFATGRRLYFGQRSEKSGGCQIQALDLSTGEIRTLAITDRLLRSRLAVTHDERSIYFTQVDEDAMDLMLVSDFR